MKNLSSLFCVATLVCLLGVGCDDTPPVNNENFGTRTGLIKYAPGDVVVLAVDFMTNSFLGGYTLPVEKGKFELEADYHSPGDFGDVTIFDKGSGTKLFAGDIIWMGTGRMTYPEEMYSPVGFTFTGNSFLLPRFTQFSYYGEEYDYFADYDLSAVRKIVSKVDIARRAHENAPDAPIYATLYARSVGMGDPAEWYWLVFIRS